MKRFVTNYPGLGPELLRPTRSRMNLPAWLPRGRSFLTPSARHALYLGWKALRLPRGSGVLVPAFVCNSVTEPLERAGARPILFEVREDISPDWDDARSRAGNARALLWYHFLGLTSGFESALSFARTHGLALIEDCAHALFSRYDNAPVGTHGALACFSIRKSLPTPIAGALVLNRPPGRTFSVSTCRPPDPAFWACVREREVYLNRLHFLAQDRTQPIAAHSYLHYNNILTPFLQDLTRTFPLDETSRLVLRNIQPGVVQRQRELNFLTYWKRLRALCPVPNGSPGAAPLGFPILVKNRDAFKQRLERDGVESSVHWPEWLLPPGAAHCFPVARKLANSILSLPCHQDLTVSDVEYACKAVLRLL